MLDFLVTVCHACFPSRERERGREKKTERGEIQDTRGRYTRKSDRRKKQRDWATDRNLLQIKDLRQKPVKSLRTTNAVKYGTVSLACVSSCHWTAGPQTRATTTDGSRPGRAYRTHTPLNVHGIMRPALVLITFKENTDTQGNLNTDFCM